MSRSRPIYEPIPRHILLVRPDHLGDVLFLRPGLKRFREALQDWHITLAVGPWSQAVAANDTDVDEIITIPFPGFNRNDGDTPWQPYRLLLGEADKLRDARPAAIVILRDDHWWEGLVARLAGAPKIIGAEHPSMNGLLTASVQVRSQHWAARNVELLDCTARMLGAEIDDHLPTPLCDPLRWNVTNHYRSSAAALLTSVGIERPFAVIHPGSGAPVKQWPTDRWARVADSLAEDGLSVILTGSEAERPYVARIVEAAQSRLTSIAGQTNVGCLAAVFDQARVVAGVDSGPLHLAVAVDTPTVHIFGPSDIACYGPWGDTRRHRVITAGLSCPRCGDLSLSRDEGAGCMVAVSVDTVLGSVRDLLSIHG
ncbi:MAG: glycosyltransferase family 9 protein [Nitrolancea sp.]